MAILVAIVGTPSPLEVADAFDRGWTLAAACFVIAAIGSLAVGEVPPEEPVAPRAREVDHGAEPKWIQPWGPTPTTLAAGGRDSPAARGSPVEFLAGVPMFAGLPPEALDRIAKRMTTVRVTAGQWLFREGEEARVSSSWPLAGWTY